MKMKMKATLLLCLVLTFTTSIWAEGVDKVDPWEGWNRQVFTFNDTMDRYILRPLAKGYRYITPGPIEGGVARMFSNLGEVLNMFNDVFQGKFAQAGNDSGRFLINSTLGLAGFFDVAENMGLPRSEGEDFGQTMGSWGVESGPYVVLPLLGSSDFRDAPSLVVDYLLYPVFYIKNVYVRNSITGVSILSRRAELIDSEDLLKGDKYSLMRDAYLQRREYLVLDGEVKDDFGDFENY